MPVDIFIDGPPSFNNASVGDASKIAPISSRDSVNGPTVKTSPSGFDFSTKAFSQNVTVKTQIYLHHTAGSQQSDKGKGTINTLNNREVSTHTVIDKDGHIEYLFDDKYISYHGGAGLIPQNLGLSVEIEAYGCLTQNNGIFYTAYKNKLPDQNTAGLAVDINGKPTPYKKHAYYQKYTPAQIAAVKTLIVNWSKKHNIPVKWEGQKSFDRLFPPNDVKGNYTTSPDAFKGISGLYSHNSIRTDKSDVFPQKELIEMFKTL